MNEPILKSLPTSSRAEQGLLGAILVDNRAYDLVQDYLLPQHFASAAHGSIYGAIQKIIEKGHVADPIILQRLFSKLDSLDAIGGQSYLSELAASAVSVRNAGEYSRVIFDYYRRRELIAMAEDAAAIAYEDDPDKDASTHIELLEEGLYQLSDDGIGSGDAAHISVALEEAITLAERARESDGSVVGISTGLKDLDALLGGLRDTNLYILAGRPAMGKTALAVNIAYSAAENDPVGLFSLEMSSEQLAQRLQSGETGINSHNINMGHISAQNIDDIKQASKRISERQLYVDDTPAISTSQLRARARRMQRKHGIKLIVVDYLQLLEAVNVGKNDGPVARTTAISKALKAIAKELRIPVLALSQLSRAVEQRDPPIPILSDLRESGCLSCETTLLTAPDGVHYNTSSHCSVSTLNKKGQIVVSASKNLNRKPKEMIRVSLRTGRSIDCTPDHPILTDVGWLPAADITAERSVALAAIIPEPKDTKRIPEARWIGWMLGNGSMVGNSSPSFICSDEQLSRDFINATEMIFGLTPRVHPHHCKAVWQYDITAGPVRTSAGNPCKNWLKEHDLWGRRSYEKYIPDWFMESADNHSVAEMLAGLIDTDGSVPVFAKQRSAVKFATTSRILAEQVLWCFARLGFIARIDDGDRKQQSHHHTLYTVQIMDGPTLARLKKVLRLTGSKGEKLKAMSCSLTGSNHGNRLGTWVGTKLVELASAHGTSQAKLGYRDQKRRISQGDLRNLLCCTSLIGKGHKDLDWLVSPDIWWDQLKSITPLGVGDVFDRQVEDGGHNFVANGIIVHNSIEQDADAVAFIYREEYYYARKKPVKRENETETSLVSRMADFQERMTEIKNLAEIIVAKQRHGPTGQCNLFFEATTCRFKDYYRD